MLSTLRASPPMEPTVQPNGHVGAACDAVNGSPKEERKLSRSRLKLGLASTSLAVGLFYGTPVRIPTDAPQRISMTARSSRKSLQATGHAFHWLTWSEQGTRGWPNDSGRLQTGLFGVALPFKLQKKGDPARPPRDALRDWKM